LEISSRSSTSSSDTRGHSAAHVLKGAVTKVLGPRKFAFVGAGVLRMRSDAALTEQEVAKIEAAANRKIAEDAEIVEFEMERQEAEGHFGTGIYDIKPAPQSGEHLSMVKIAEWDASYCPQGHAESTGSIGAIRVDGATFDGTTKEVVLRFHLL
jgi:alanyl-tRNA synthetase